MLAGEDQQAVTAELSQRRHLERERVDVVHPLHGLDQRVEVRGLNLAAEGPALAAHPAAEGVQKARQGRFHGSPERVGRLQGNRDDPGGDSDLQPVRAGDPEIHGRGAARQDERSHLLNQAQARDGPEGRAARHDDQPDAPGLDGRVAGRRGGGGRIQPLERQRVELRG